MTEGDHPVVSEWLAGIDSAYSPAEARPIKRSRRRQVWEIDVTAGPDSFTCILSIFQHTTFEKVNTTLSPAETAEKCFLCCSELPGHGVPTPPPIGWYASAHGAAFLCHKVPQEPWCEDTRSVSARHLARLHLLDIASLSTRLADLCRLSEPRGDPPLRSMTNLSGEFAPWAQNALVHGDYFSKNVLRHGDRLHIIDWETFGLGDAMWDLGFLLGADGKLPDAEIDAVTNEYAKYAPVDEERLSWYRRNWEERWNTGDWGQAGSSQNNQEHLSGNDKDSDPV